MKASSIVGIDESCDLYEETEKWCCSIPYSEGKHDSDVTEREKEKEEKK